MQKRIASILILCIMFLYCPISVAAKTVQDPYKEVDEYLKSAVKNANIPGMSVMVVDNDSVLFSNTYGNCDNINQPFIIGSMSKSFTAICIVKLVEQGKVNLDEPIASYLTNVTDGGKISVRQLLNQTGGLGEYQNLSNFEITDSYGTHQYADVNYGLLGKIIESVSGMSYAEYVEENIFRPLAMNHSAATLEQSLENGLIDGYRNFFGIPVAGKPDYPNENSWTQVSAGYISSSASDMGKYLQMYLNNGADVVTAKSIDTVLNDSVYVESEPPYSYGMGWTLSKAFDELVYGHSGLVENYMSDMFILPKSNIGIVILMNTNDYFAANGMANDISLKLIGYNPAPVSETKYLMVHLLVDAIYLVIFLTAVIPLFLLRRYKKGRYKKISAAMVIAILHMIVPTVLLGIPSALSIPMWTMRYYVPDLFLVLIISAALLYIGGFVKIVLMCKANRSLENLTFTF